MSLGERVGQLIVDSEDPSDTALEIARMALKALMRLHGNRWAAECAFALGDEMATAHQKDV